MPGVNSSTILNKWVESLICGELLLVEEYGLQAYNDFMLELAMMHTGVVEYKDLGISERRHAQITEFYQMADGARPAKVVRDKPDLYEYWQNIPDNSLAVIKVHGIMRSTSAASTRGVDMIERDLFEAYDKEKIAGVVLEVHSGGGESAAGFRLADAVAARNKPVLAFTHVAGSAAYLVASRADEIMMPEGSRVGGIGAFVSIDKRLLTEHAENFLDIYDPASTDKNYEFREAKLGNYKPLEKSLEVLATEFRKSVTKYRPLAGEDEFKTKTLAGGMFAPREAKQRGLADLSGNINDAIARTWTLAKRKKKMS